MHAAVQARNVVDDSNGCIVIRVSEFSIYEAFIYAMACEPHEMGFCGRLTNFPHPLCRDLTHVSTHDA